MVFVNYTNNAQNIPVVASFTDVTPTILLKTGEGDLLPSANGRVTIEMLNLSLEVIKREVIHYTTRTGDLLSGLSRSVELCVQDDTANPRERTQLTLDFTPGAGQVVVCSLRYTELNDQELKEAIDEAQEGVNFVKLTGDQTITGIKTFSSSPIVPTPTTDFQTTTKKYVDDNIISASAPVALYEKDEYIAGETILANDSLFVESLPTFAESTVLQNIGDVAGNTRVAILGIGSGVASNTLKLSLRKFVSPSANLSVRIETVSGGNPTGTLVNANATATVTSASVTTSLVDTTITLAGSITITKGQQVAIVLSQVGGVVNATNYYGVGVANKDSSTRRNKRWDGTARGDTQGPISNNGHGFAFGTGSGSYTQVYTIIPEKFVRVVSMTSGFTLNGGGYVNVPFTGTNILLHRGFTYTLTKSYINASTFQSSGLVQNDLYISILFPSQVSDQLSIQTEAIGNFSYVSSTLFENRVLSETSATYSYKLPTDYVRLATQGYSVGQSVTSKYYGLHTYSGLVDNTIYYVANTPGAISAVAGTNPYVLGKTNNATIIKIDGKILNRAITVSASPFSYTNTTGGPIQVSITGGTVNPIVINGVTTATATNHINTLPAGATMTVTYTVLPTITYSDL